MRRAGVLAGLFGLSLLLAVPACGPSYPKDRLHESIQKLFEKEVGTSDVRSELVGGTLYVTFPVKNMVTASLDLPEEVTEKLQNAMLSVSRIAMSTDAKINFTVLEARDDTWGVLTTFIRRIEDLKFMYYYKISRSDFDERFILETRQFDPEKNPVPAPREDLKLSDYMARWVAFRINFGSRSNPIVGMMLGVEKVEPSYEEEARTLRLKVHGSQMYEIGASTASLSGQLLRNSIFEQMKKVETKYLDRLPEPQGWAEKLVVENIKGEAIFSAPRKDWLEYEIKDSDR